MATQLPIPLPTSNPLVVQHNAMVNAGFSMTSLEMRFFLAMLSRIGREDTTLPLCRIAVKEICSDSSSATVYADVREMVTRISTRSLLMEVLGPNGERLKQPDIRAFPLMGAAYYLKKEGVVEAVFNEHLRPYLLELTSNFTKAQLSQVLKIKRPTSHRIYWLLREYASFGKRTIGVDELRHLLGFKDEYADRFDHFRTRVLDPAQEELAQTDLPFTYEVIKQGRVNSEIRFLFSPSVAQLPPAPAIEDWAQSLVAAGIAAKSLVVVREKLAAGEYDEGYVQYVLLTVQTQAKTGKIKKAAGAIFKALTEGYLLADYQKAQQAPPAAPAKGRPSASVAAQRKKVEDQLADARNSLQFVQSAIIYTDETRPAAVAQVQATIQELEAQLASLTK
jgi:hypothetical protein